MSPNLMIDPLSGLGHVTLQFHPGSGKVHPRVEGPLMGTDFTAFARSRIAEDMPHYTQRIDGYSSVAQHLAATASLDACYQTEPPDKAKAIRKALHYTFIFYHHLLQLYLHRGNAEKGWETLFATSFAEEAKQVLHHVNLAQRALTVLGGRGAYPEIGIPGGVSHGISEAGVQQLEEIARQLRDFAEQVQATFIEGPTLRWIEKEEASLPVYSMGSVDTNGKSTLYCGEIRVVSPDGEELARVKPEEILSVIGFYNEDESEARFPFLKDVGWQGFVPGANSGVYQVGPLARLNASIGLPTPKAQEALERLWETLGEPPVHRSSALVWGYVIELLQAAEMMVMAVEGLQPGEEGLRSPLGEPGEGIGVVESPTGTLIHHYTVDQQGLIEGAEVLLPKTVNTVAINTALAQALGKVLSSETAPEENEDLILAQVEQVFRAYQPSLSPTATVPLRVTLQHRNGEIVKRWRQP